MSNKFTPTQVRILAVLSDGLPHRREELRDVLPDELGSLDNVRPHLTAIRRVLRPRGEDIVCEFSQAPGTKRCWCYRHVRLLASADDGQR